MSFGDGDLHVQVAQLKTENARLKQRNGELEALVRYMEPWIDGAVHKLVIRRMDALGIEVDS